MIGDDLGRIDRGWRVVGSDGAGVGEVEQVHEDMLVVRHSRLFGEDRLYVPVDALSEVRDDAVVLNIEAGNVGEQGWHVRPSSAPPRGVELATSSDADDMTTMTGAGFGAGGTPGAAGPVDPTRGRQIEDRFGGSGRAGLGSPRLDDDEEVVPETMRNRPPDANR